MSDTAPRKENKGYTPRTERGYTPSDSQQDSTERPLPPSPPPIAPGDSGPGAGAPPPDRDASG